MGQAAWGDWTVLKTFKATVDENGNVRLIEPVKLPPECQLLVTVLDAETPVVISTTALLSEAALDDWLRPEEEGAWAYLQEEDERGR